MNKGFQSIVYLHENLVVPMICGLTSYIIFFGICIDFEGDFAKHTIGKLRKQGSFQWGPIQAVRHVYCDEIICYFILYLKG